MTKPNIENEDGQDGLFFLTKIETLSELGTAEFALWLGRGAWAGMTLEHQEQAQRAIDKQRARLNGAVLLDRAGSV